MEDEKKPLLFASRENGTNSPNGSNSDESGNSSESLTLTTIRVPIYGTYQPHFKSVAAEEQITYTWNEINAFANVSQRKSICKRKKEPPLKKHILKNMFGIAHPGELLAIMGSSGAGKTTLLNALTFQSASNLTVTGIRRINANPVTPKSLINQSAYVQQDDLFIGTLTVKEHLIFQALVRMDKELTRSQRLQRVDEVISEFGLSKCQNTQIGVTGFISGISGGEKKRLSFASVILNNPQLMFCDEPTSGLDSFMAQNTIQVLKSMAVSGKTIICTIHQPSSEIYALFDKILLMAEGRAAFLGSPQDADDFFKQLEAPCPKNYNPADYYVQLLAIVPEKEDSCRQAVNLICDKYERAEIGVHVALQAAGTTTEIGYDDVWIGGEQSCCKSRYKISWCNQFKAVLWRSWLSVIKEPLIIKVRLVQTVITSLVIGLIYFGQNLDQNGAMNINGVLFLFLTNMTFQNVFAVVNVFCAELPIFLREHRSGMYRTDVYFLCKTLAESPIFIAIPLIFTAICYFMIGLNGSFVRFSVTCAIVILVTNVATSFGYLISCASSNITMAMSIGPPLIIPFLLFGGFFLNIKSIPVYFSWISYLSWFRYGMESLMINQWDGITNIQCPNRNSTCPRNGHVILQTYNFDEDNFIVDLLALFGLILGFRLLAFACLLFKTKQKN